MTPTARTPEEEQTRQADSAARPTPKTRRHRAYSHLQALDDAIKYRTARLRTPCRKCRPCSPCIAHACDLNLLGTYREMARAAVAMLEADRQRTDAARSYTPVPPQDTTG
jgi:hypothetical protein